MKFLISVIDSQSNSGSPDEMVEIDAFNDKLRANGHWIFAGGLEALTSAFVLDNRDGGNQVTAGPLIDAKEFISGFWIIDASDNETAFTLALEGSRACNRQVELRKFNG